MSPKTPPDRGGREALRVGKLLAELYATEDAALASFRDRRCPEAGDGAPESLRRARDVLDALGEALESPDPALWRRLEAAWRILTEVATETKAKADLEKAEAEAAPKPRPKRAVAAAPAAAAMAGAPASAPEPAKTSPSTPDKPPSVFSAAPVEPDASPAWTPPERGASPWVRPSVAWHADAATPSEPPAATPRPSVDETQALDLGAISLEPLPFKGTHEPPAPGAGLEERHLAPPSDLDGTGILLAPLSLDGTLPFVGARSLRKKLAHEAALREQARRAPATSPPPHAPTALLSPASSDAGASAPGGAELTVEEYAWLCAQCDVDPARAASLDKDHGLAGAGARRALDASWRERFRADTGLYRAFYARFHEYRGMLLAAAGRPSGPR
ncbi:MAG: hypothetical protein HY825_19045 [Acidobacteria bacterium]|nr:hypothetical protein [Acidobacteriota bacterium]